MHQVDSDLELYNKINEIQKKTRQTYGYRRMTIAVNKDSKVEINHKKVFRVMQKYSLLSVIRRKYIYKGSDS